MSPVVEPITLDELGLRLGHRLDLSGLGGGGAGTVPDIYSLFQSVNAGDQTIRFDRNPTTATGTTFWIVDPYTPDAELLAGTVSGAVMTLATQALTTSRPPEYIASTKTIRLRRPITSIVGNGVTTTVTTATPHGLITANSVVISGTVNWRDPNSGHLNAVQTGAITVTSTTTFTFLSAVNASESTGFAVETGMAYQFALTSVGRALVITGSASNNKVVTVASIVSPSEITVNETLTDENGSNVTTFTQKLAYNHASGAPVLRWRGGLVPFEMWGARESDTAVAGTNTAAFNRFTRNLYNVASGASGLLLTGGYYVNDELKPELSQVIQGLDPLRCGFYAVAPFPFDSTGQVALIHPQRNGQPVLYEQSGPSGRWWFRRFFVNAQNLTNGNGILSSPQQPDHTLDIRVQNCPGYGVAFHDVQYHHITNPQFDNCGIALYLWGAAYVRAYDLNITSPSGLIAVKMVGVNDSSFYGGLLETVPTTGKIFSITAGCSRLGLYDIYTSGFSGGSTGDVFYIDSVGNPSSKCTYIITNAFCNQNSATVNLVNDIQRSITITTAAGDSDRSLVFMFAQDGVYSYFLGGTNEIVSGGYLRHAGTRVGFNGSTPVAKPTVSGSRGGNAAVASLLTALASEGLITDSSSA